MTRRQSLGTASAVCFLLGVIAAVVALVGGCAQTPQGQSIDRSNNVDLGTTVAALMSGAVEANPLMPYIIPAKWLMGRYVDTRPCESRVRIATAVNPIFYGASANNIAVTAGAATSLALPIGIAGGLTYWVLRERVEPDNVFTCEVDGHG
jgi:hypothetical protein